MSDSPFKLVTLPDDETLERMTSGALASVSAQLTSEKDQYFALYKSRQEKIHTLIQRKQKTERVGRAASDPDYNKKTQRIVY